MRFELVDLEQQQQQQQRRQGAQTSNGSGDGGSSCGRRLIVLRRYSPYICLLELLAILLFLYLLLFWRPAGPGEQCFSGQNSQTRSFAFDDKDGGAAKQLLLDLMPGCDQRKHDIQMGVRCKSAKPAACGPVETWERRVVSEMAPVTIVTTSKSGQRLVRRQEKLAQVICGADCWQTKTRAEVDLKARRQKIIGWGGALTDSSLNNMLSLTTNGTHQLLDNYFGPDGLRFNLARITIGGSDFSSRFYTNDDVEDDSELSHFQLQDEDILYKIPALKLISERFGQHPELSRRNGGQIKVFASMWSPPKWMKTNNHFNKGQLKGRIGHATNASESVGTEDEERYYRMLAKLKVKFIRAYQERGLTFWGLTVMNEPVFAVQPFLDFNTMIFPREDYANYVAKYLGPMLKSDERLKHIKLMAHDDNRRFLASFTWPMLDQPQVHQFIDGVSVHGYADEDYHLLEETLERYSKGNRSVAGPVDGDFFVLPTELCSGHLPFMEKALVGNWDRGVHYALDIIRSVKYGAAGWVDWNMALDLEGGPGWLGGRLDAPVIVDKARDLFHMSPMFYVLGHFSRYIPPGSVKLDTSLANAHYDHQLELVAFLLPQYDPLSGLPPNERQRVATVVLNNNPYPVDLHLRLAHSSDPRSFLLVPCPADSIQTIIHEV